MKKLHLVLLLCCCALASAAKGTNISLSLDVAQFRNTDGKSYLEIYYSLPENDPHYILQEGRYQCDVLLSLEILNSDTLWANKTWRITNSLADTVQKDITKQLVDLIRYPIVTGQAYHITLFARDLKKSSLDSMQLDFISQDFTESAPLLSDAQLANSITPFDSSCAEAFHKRFYCVVPNPEMTFGEQNKEMSFYYEAYELQKTISAHKFRVFARVLDNRGEPFTQVPSIIHDRDLRQNMIREIGKFSVQDLASGAYKLEYGLLDSANTVLNSKTKVFLVHNPSLKPLSPLFAQDGQVLHFLDGYDLKMLDEEYDKLFAVMQKEDRDLYRSIKEPEGKRAFLYNFWLVSKPVAEASAESFRSRYLQECQYVNTYYSRSGKPGWRTDRGVIYLRYGKPSDIERHAVSKDTKPYEIWNYENIENGVIFVFVDRSGFNQYELIHSTKRGELYDPNYQRLLQPTSNDYFKM